MTNQNSKVLLTRLTIIYIIYASSPFDYYYYTYIQGVQQGRDEELLEAHFRNYQIHRLQTHELYLI